MFVWNIFDKSFRQKEGSFSFFMGGIGSFLFEFEVIELFMENIGRFLM